jgi:hypothetical protein
VVCVPADLGPLVLATVGVPSRSDSYVARLALVEGLKALERRYAK